LLKKISVRRAKVTLGITETELLLTALDNFNIIFIKRFHKESINNKVNGRYL